MIKTLQTKGFKSWLDTGNLTIAPLTGLFGANSSGKTSLLQLLLMLKQTVESTDRKRVLHTGDKNTIVDLGTFYDLIHSHKTDASLNILLSWDINKPLKIHNPEEGNKVLYEIKEMSFEARIKEISNTPIISKIEYSNRGDFCGFPKFGMQIKQSRNSKLEYELISEEYKAKRYKGRVWPLPAPVKCYGFPDEVYGYYQNVGFLSEFVLEFEELFGNMYYLGPLREYPQRSYSWAGEAPEDVGKKGELAVAAILASKEKGTYISPGYRKKHRTLEERIAHWLKEMGMIHSFNLKPIAKHRKDYELRVRKTKDSPEVYITDVGFGVSQILPVLVLCYYVPEGSVILLEQPEIHLHPSVQSWLADVFIEVVQNRNVQIIVESHSEHLLRRLQRRIAEELIPVEKTALYFCRMDNSQSVIEKLDVDLFGNISNWPKDFFGDDLGDLVAKTEAEINRQSSGK